jgi:hypothetical protein
LQPAFSGICGAKPSATRRSNPSALPFNFFVLHPASQGASLSFVELPFWLDGLLGDKAEMRPASHFTAATKIEPVKEITAGQTYQEEKDLNNDDTSENNRIGDNRLLLGYVCVVTAPPARASILAPPSCPP